MYFLFFFFYRRNHLLALEVGVSELGGLDYRTLRTEKPCTLPGRWEACWASQRLFFWAGEWYDLRGAGRWPCVLIMVLKPDWLLEFHGAFENTPTPAAYFLPLWLRRWFSGALGGRGGGGSNPPVILMIRKVLRLFLKYILTWKCNCLKFFHVISVEGIQNSPGAVMSHPDHSKGKNFSETAWITQTLSHTL